MTKVWRRNLHIIARRNNLHETTLASAICDNGGKVDDIDGTASSFVSFSDIEVDTLDEDTAWKRISGNDAHERIFGQTDLKVIYRLTLKDGQRIIYVQCADCFESFLAQDSHVSFDREKK